MRFGCYGAARRRDAGTQTDAMDPEAEGRHKPIVPLGRALPRVSDVPWLEKVWRYSCSEFVPLLPRLVVVVIALCRQFSKADDHRWLFHGKSDRRNEGQ